MIIRLFSIFAIFCLVSTVACDSSQTAPSFEGSEEVGASDGASPSESDASGGDDGSGDDGNGGSEGTPSETFDNFISGLSIPGEGSEAFQTPSSGNLNSFNGVIADLLDGKEPSSSTLDDLGYTLTLLDNGGSTVHALSEDTSTGGGIFIVDQNSSSNLVLEVPHPLNDSNTLDEGAHLFKSLGAKALFIAGTHRCANAATSSCSGTTDVCGAEGPHRISDVAHATENFFHEAHKAADDTLSAAMIISIHGFSVEDGDPSAIVSNGSSKIVGQFAFVNQVRAALNDELSGDDYAVSCNKAGDPDFGHCGTTNVQGRYTNGSSDECSTAAATVNGRFLHLEQDPTLRADSNGWDLVSDALDQVF